MKARLFLAILLVPAFSGCFQQEVFLPSSIDDVTPFSTYYWPPAVRHDSAGHVLDNASEEQVQRVVEMLLPHGGYSIGQVPIPPTYPPTMAVTKSGLVLTTVMDHLIGSSDGGVTWTDLHDLHSNNYPATPDRYENAGASVWVDASSNRIHLGHRLYSGAISCQIIFLSDDEGKTWRESRTNSWPTSCATDTRQLPLISDWERIFGGAHGANSAPVPGRAATVSYWCEVNLFVGPKCSASPDGGETYANDGVLAPPDPNCWRANIGRPSVNKAGVAMVPLGPDQLLLQPCFAKPPRVSVSSDDGLTWEVRTMPNASFINTELAPSMYTTPDDMTYMSLRGPDHLVYLVRSKDAFRTWEGPWRVSPPGHTLGYLTTVVAGDEGRLAVGYFGTKTEQQPKAMPMSASGDTIWHFYVSTVSEWVDGKPVFVTTQVTPQEDPVETGRAAPPNAGNLGRFMDSALGADGRYYFAFIDGCNPRNGCTTDLEGAFVANDHEVMMAVLDSGPSLLSGGPLLPTLGLNHPDPVVK